MFILLPEFSFSLVVDPVIEPFVDPIVVVDTVVVFGKMIEMTFKPKPSSGTIVDPIFDVSACVKKVSFYTPNLLNKPELQIILLKIFYANNCSVCHLSFLFPLLSILL